MSTIKLSKFPVNLLFIWWFLFTCDSTKGFLGLMTRPSSIQQTHSQIALCPEIHNHFFGCLAYRTILQTLLKKILWINKIIAGKSNHQSWKHEYTRALLEFEKGTRDNRLQHKTTRSFLRSHNRSFENSCKKYKSLHFHHRRCCYLLKLYNTKSLYLVFHFLLLWTYHLHHHWLEGIQLVHSLQTQDTRLW